jgi:hypothetical protein
MLGTITKGAYDNTPIPDNVYLAKLLKVVEKAPPATHPDWYPSLSWTFQILTDPFKNRRAFGKTPTQWIAGKKLDTWLVAIGINAAKGQSVKIEDIKDQYVKILVKGKKYNDKETGEEKIFSEVKELLPLDSLDQIKLRELLTVMNVVASATNVAPAPVQTAPIVPQPNVTAGGYVPVTSTTAVPTIPIAPVASTSTPAPTVGGPTRTIPF